MISTKRLEQLRWRREDLSPARAQLGMKRDYSHPAGWQIKHCGHPTALWPYLLIDPNGARILTGAAGPLHNPEYGTAWPTVEAAVDYVAKDGRTCRELLTICTWNQTPMPKKRQATPIDLTQVSDEDLAREWVRRLNLKRQAGGNVGGRPKTLHPCPHGCSLELGARELRAHLPHCPKR